jgi:aspartate/methionine/tyrosine aminotransferase
MIQRMFMVLAQSSRGPSTFVQDAASAALSGPQDCVAAMRQEYARRRSQVLDAVKDLPRVKVAPPEGGFFAMVDVSGIDPSSDAVRRRLLQENGLVVIHGAAYGPRAEGTLRVSFASGGDTLSRGLSLLREGLR